MKQNEKKGKKSLLNIIFGRFFVFSLMIIMQILGYIALMINVSGYATIFYFLKILSIILVFYIISERKTDPTIKLIWSVIILIFPIFGVLVYVYAKTYFGSYKIKHKLSESEELTGGYLSSDYKVYDSLRETQPTYYGIAKYLYNYSGFPIYKNTSSIFLKSGEEKFDLLLADIKSAKKFIFLEYFIIEKGYMWDTILKELIEKQKQGVEIRVMYDGMCSLFQLPIGYYKQLEKIGIQSKPFSPIRPLVTTDQNHRDHRKIAIIDGTIAYTGGINLADEYMNLKERFGYWKDVSVRIEGDAVQNFTAMFLRMWNLSSKEIEQFNDYIDVPMPKLENAGGFCCAYGDNPFDDENVGEMVYLDILNSAMNYVHIVTPYLVLDNLMMDALKFAAKRGVEVKIVLPGIPDKKYAYCLARTYYEELIEAGVKIYEYTPGFTHAKYMVADDRVAVVGSINLDYRSLYLHFESGVLLIDCDTINEIKLDYAGMVEESERVTMMVCRNRSFWYKNAGKLLRILAPML